MIDSTKNTNKTKGGLLCDTFSSGFGVEDGWNNYLMVVRDDHPRAAMINHTGVAKNVFGCNKRAKIARLPANNSMA